MKVIKKSSPIKRTKFIKSKVAGYKNTSLPAHKRARDLIKRMTLEEKIAQMLCVWDGKKTILYNEEGELDLSKLKFHFKEGMGQIARLSDTGSGLSPIEMAEMSNTLQKYFVEETRLGIPVIFHEECLHGLAAKDATSYPQPIGMASSFNPELIQKVYSAIADETRARGAHQALAPVVDVAREPRWGRVEETFGEDPYLVAQLGIAAVKGFQGDGSYNDKKHVFSTLKHFAAHGQPESGTNCAPVNISERLLRDIFLYPFKQVIEKANVASVMASYNEIDGIPSHANKWLLRTVLRDEWGFKGFVVSDYYAITELNYREEAVSNMVAADKTEAARISALAGVNIELPDIDCYNNLLNLVNDEKLDESVVDELVLSMLEYKFKLGLFDDPYVDANAVNNDEKLIKNRSLALTAAHETMVLLKNQDAILPLDPNKSKTISVIGPNADRLLLGGYSGEPKYYTSVLQGIKERVGDKINIHYSEGCQITIGGSWNEDIVTAADPENNRQLIKGAVEVAKKSDIIILALGGNEQTSREAWNNTHMGDRASLDLLGNQNELFEEISALGKPIIVLLFNGRPKSINYISEKANAILECWYLGQETGVAVADVLFGKYNPSGKLPISFPRSAGHIPCYYNYKPAARRGYLFDDITPLYVFGYGLSYTTFSITNLRLEKTSIKRKESVKVFVDVENKGSVAGEEVVQLYIHDMVSSVTRPVKELKNFKKINLNPGEVKTILFEIFPEHLAFTNINKKYIVEPGQFEIMVGNSSRDEDIIRTVLSVE
jgi:beta-glucosidase